jgi:hypothetical protein
MLPQPQRKGQLPDRRLSFKSGQWKRIVNKHDIEDSCQACKDIPKPNSNQLADMQKALDGKIVEKNEKKI